MKFKPNIFIVLLLVMFSFVPFVTFGEEAGPVTAETTKTSTLSENDNNFCSQLLSIKDKIKEQIAKALDKQSAYQDDRNTIIENKENEADSKLTISRIITEDKRLDNWDKMLSSAKTDEQKTAVTTYQTTVGGAVDARRTSVDEAVSAYRDGLSKIVILRTEAVSDTVSAFKEVMNTAIQNGEDDCANNITSEKASENFIKKISEAKDILVSSTKNDKTKTDILELKKVRDDAIEKAETIFNSSVDKAQEDLIIALKQ